jgi:hypothetical protein
VNGGTSQTLKAGELNPVAMSIITNTFTDPREPLSDWPR